MNPPVPISVARSRRVVVIALPPDRSDMFLLFEELAQQCRAQTPFEALAFVASAQANRSEALWLFREFEAHAAAPRRIPCSLLVVDDAAQAFDLLPAILSELGASRFAFLASGTFLTPQGWARLGAALAPGATELAFFALQSDDAERRPPADAVSGRCFAWSTGPFIRWAQAAPSFLGGFHRDNGLMRAGTAQTVHHGTAYLTRTPLADRITDAVNEAVYTARLAEAGMGPAGGGARPATAGGMALSLASAGAAA